MITKPLTAKQQASARIEQQIAAFLDSGNRITYLPQNCSGIDYTKKAKKGHRMKMSDKSRMEQRGVQA